MTKNEKSSVQTPWYYVIYTLSLFLELLDGGVHYHRLETDGSICVILDICSLDKVPL